MKKKLQKPIIMSVLALIVVCGLALSARYMWSLIRNKRNTDSIQSFAQQLGYTPDAHLTQYETCWDIFPSRCGLVRLYTTAMDRDELQAEIDDLASTKTRSREVHGYELFDASRVTRHTLTINGISDSSDRSRIPEPLAFKWRIAHGDKNWVITLYEIANDGQTYEFDGRPIKDNIVSLMLRTK